MFSNLMVWVGFSYLAIAMKIGSILIWRRAALGLAAATVIFAGGWMAGSRLLTLQRTPSTNTDLLARVNQLDAELKQMRQPEKQSSEIISSARNSVCFIVSSYWLTDSDGSSASMHYRLFGTGFLTNDGIVVSNRHVMEPWFGDPKSQDLIFHGFVPHRERVLAYFPSLSTPVELSNFLVSSETDVAVAHVNLPTGAAISPLRLAQSTSAPGDPVLVIGYPLGITTMVAKSTALPYELSGLRSDEQQADRLARIKLIRPSATHGHLSDVIGTSLMYDASTAHGSSGGPVLNMRGEVVGVNAALINGFNGTSLGVSVEALQDLLRKSELRGTLKNSQSGRPATRANSHSAN